MRRDFTFRRQLIIGALTLLIGADVFLIAYSWNLRSAPKIQQELDTLTRDHRLLQADINRAKQIQQDIPAIQKDCDKFEASLFPDSTGYSSVSAEIGTLASKAGLQVESKAFHQSEVKGRNLTEVNVDATVSGNYASVVHFLNDLQRSSSVYAVKGLTAKSDKQNSNARGALRVTVHIKTYFRTA